MVALLVSDILKLLASRTDMLPEAKKKTLFELVIHD
jgi:hypothetical protein